MILESPQILGLGASAGLDTIALAKKLKSYLVLVSLLQDDTYVDRIIWRKTGVESRGAEFAGVILNLIPRTHLERIKRFRLPVLEKNSVRILGIVPENIELKAPTVREVCDILQCEILTSVDKLDNRVEDFLVGAMTPETALAHFRRSLRKAVITGGDRSDIQLAALETDTSAIILTGNIYPDVRVLTRAEELQVPVLLVTFDTYTTIKRLEALTGRIKPFDKKKIELAKKQIDEYVYWSDITKLLSLKKQ
jgi:BioD-like phosphotransacetylase family protein